MSGSHRSRQSPLERWAPVAMFLVVALTIPALAYYARTSPEPVSGTVTDASSQEMAAEMAAELRRPPAALSGEIEAPEEAVEGTTFVVDRAYLRRERIAARKAAAAEARKIAAKKAAAKAARLADKPITVSIGSFNVLGSQHTGPGGERRYASASVRTPAQADLIARHGVDILGTQELQADQLRGLQARTGMAAYPGFAWGEAETDNSILYDAGVYELVEGDSFTITFMGRARPQPIAKFKDLATGRMFYVINTHPSAGGGAYTAQRRAGQSALVSVVNGLREEGLPILVTGDMNDREEFYCRVVPPTGMTASNGGSYAGGCAPPPSPVAVDWVVGSGVDSWSSYWRDTSPVDRRISDHFFISATAHLG